VLLIVPSGYKITLAVPSVETLSAIGTGDSFNAGLISQLHHLGITKENLTENITKELMSKMIAVAIKFGSHVCTHYDNYISKDFAGELK